MSNKLRPLTGGVDRNNDEAMKWQTLRVSANDFAHLRGVGLPVGCVM